jgi:hypothetical protein
VPCRDFVRFAVHLAPGAHVSVIDRVRHGRTHEGPEDSEAMAGSEHAGQSPLMQTGVDRARRGCRLGVLRGRDGGPSLETRRRAGRQARPPSGPPTGVDSFTTATAALRLPQALDRMKYTPTTWPFAAFDPSQTRSCWPAEGSRRGRPPRDDPSCRDRHADLPLSGRRRQAPCSG